MFWDDLIRRWRRENRQLSRGLLAGAAGYVAVAPSRPRRRRSTVVLLIGAVAALLALVLVSGRVQAAAWADASGAVTIAPEAPIVIDAR